MLAFGEYVFRGCRVQKKGTRRFDAFESPAELPIGYITEEILLATERVLVRRSRSKPLEFRPWFSDGVVQLSLIPGLEPELLRPVLRNELCKGIILRSFGAGNVPNEGVYSFTGFIREAVHLDKREALEAGAIPTGDMTDAAATVKFRWVLHRTQEAIEDGSLVPEDKLAGVREMMGTVYVGEMTPPHAGWR